VKSGTRIELDCRKKIVYAALEKKCVYAHRGFFLHKAKAKNRNKGKGKAEDFNIIRVPGQSFRECGYGSGGLGLGYHPRKKRVNRERSEENQRKREYAKSLFWQAKAKERGE